jgi:hypothetical protein
MVKADGVMDVIWGHQRELAGHEPMGRTRETHEMARKRMERNPD